MSKLFLLFVPVCFLISCGSGGNKEKEKKDFYPISGYIRSQLVNLDSMLPGILHYRTANGITDSLVIEKAAFRNTVAAAFIGSDISSPEKMKDYEETPFLDAGTGTMTLVYTAVSDKVPVRKIDVLLSFDSEVQTIYIERDLPVAGSAVIQKMLWTHNKSCQVISIIRKEGMEEQIVLDKYVWSN